MKRFIRRISAVVATVAMAAVPTMGTAGASSIYGTGPGSYNAIYSGYSGGYCNHGDLYTNGFYGMPRRFANRINRTNVTNINNVNIRTTTFQFAESGDATVARNTFGGSAWTGDASNSSMTHVSVTVNN